MENQQPQKPTDDQIKQNAIITEKMGLFLTLIGQVNIAEKWLLTGLTKPKEFTDQLKGRLTDAVHEIEIIENKFDV